MLLDATIIGVAVGFAARGKLRNLSDVPLKGVVWIILLTARYGVQLAAQMGWPYLDVYGVYLHVLLIFLLCLTVWLHRSSPAIVLIGIGILLNSVAIAANGGKMPVSGEALSSLGQVEFVELLGAGEAPTHQLLTGETRLPFLADVIALKPPYPLPKIVSVGDALLALGALWFLIGGMLGRPSVTGKRLGVEVRRLTVRF